MFDFCKGGQSANKFRKSRFVDLNNFVRLDASDQGVGCLWMRLFMAIPMTPSIEAFDFGGRSRLLFVKCYVFLPFVIFVYCDIYVLELFQNVTFT